MTCDRKWIIYAWKPSSGAELPQFCNEDEDKIPPYQLKTHFQLLQILDADIITKDATTRFRGKVLDTIASKVWKGFSLNIKKECIILKYLKFESKLHLDVDEFIY